MGWIAARQWQADAYLFLRPDLLYHQSFRPILEAISRGKKSGLCLPLWQGWGGANDRFAIATTVEAAASYAERVDHIVNYCEITNRPLSAEEFLLYRLVKDHVPLWFTTIKASRVRFQGELAKENYKLLRISNLPAVLHAFSTGFGATVKRIAK